jgi:hypothetical protein
VLGVIEARGRAGRDGGDGADHAKRGAIDNGPLPGVGH